MHQHKSIIIFVITIIFIFIFAGREAHDSTYKHGYYHKKIEVIEVLDCYNGSIVICNISILEDSKIKEIEHKNSILERGDEIYRLCFHRGTQRDARCYIELSPTLPAKYRSTRSEVVFDE